MAATPDSKSGARKGVRVQLPPPVPFLDKIPPAPVGSSSRGAVAQLGEHKAGSLGVRGSTPLSSTNLTNGVCGSRYHRSTACLVTFSILMPCRKHRTTRVRSSGAPSRSTEVTWPSSRISVSAIASTAVGEDLNQPANPGPGFREARVQVVDGVRSARGGL
jgi:hypothetical protein